MKNILLLLLGLVLIASTVEAKIVTKDNLYQIPKTKIAPVIDGLQDQVWKVLDWNMMRNYHTDGTCDSGAGLTGMSKAMWDANNLYLLFYTVDDVVVDIPANATWNQDGLEFYVDGSNDKTTETALHAGQYQWNMPHYLKGQIEGHKYISFTGGVDTTGIEEAITDVTDTQGFPGWILELKVPLDALAIDGSSCAGQKIGWEFQCDESDNGTARESDAKWWSDNGGSWANAALWGTAILSSREVDTVLQIVKAAKAITIDGTLDAEYLNANSVTTNLFRVDATATDVVDTDPMFGGFVTAYPLWDANNFYIFFDVVDQVVVDIPTNPNYNQDGMELYIEPTNDHSTESSITATQYHLTFPHWIFGQETGKWSTVGTTLDSTGVVYKIVDHDARGNDGSLTEEGSGYNVEIKIPLANLGIDGSSAGAQIGFEFQLNNGNDATAGRVGMEKWWNETNNSWANAGIWGYAQLSDERIDPTIVRVKASPSVISSYKLEQNYPNPFNPSTKITFELAKSEKVTLAVYNILGEQVAELVNGMMSASSHTITFDAKNLASGIYFYKLEAGSTVLAKKMILLK